MFAQPSIHRLACCIAMLGLAAAAAGEPASQPRTPEEAAARQESLRREIQSLTGRTDPAVVLAPDTLNDLMKERDRVQIEFVGKNARERAIEEKIAELTDKARQLVHDDETLKQLQAVADAQKERAQILAKQHGAGVASNADVQAQIAAAGEARARVEERKETLIASVGGGVLPALNKELVAVSLDVTQARAVLSELDMRIDRWIKAQALAIEWRRLETTDFTSRSHPATAPR